MVRCSPRKMSSAFIGRNWCAWDLVLVERGCTSDGMRPPTGGSSFRLAGITTRRWNFDRLIEIFSCKLRCERVHLLLHENPSSEHKQMMHHYIKTRHVYFTKGGKKKNITSNILLPFVGATLRGLISSRLNVHSEPQWAGAAYISNPASNIKTHPQLLFCFCNRQPSGNYVWHRRELPNSSVIMSLLEKCGGGGDMCLHLVARSHEPVVYLAESILPERR